MDWGSLEKSIQTCRICPELNIKGRTESAPGYGNKESKIVLVGQSLCYECMFTQIPFTGGSGFILDKVFEVLKIKKSDIFITNLVKCHPDKNRPSKTEEKENCLPYLKDEISLIKPELVVPLGADAVTVFLGRCALSDVVNTKFTNDEFEVVPMFHPAYLMRQSSKLLINSYIAKFVVLLRQYL